jgi:hypothetical protein
MKNFQLPSRNSIQIAFKSRFPAIKDISFLQCSHLFSDPYPSPKMAHQGRFSAAILSTILLLCLHPLASVSARAAIFTVGDDSGWTFTIEDWTKGKKFKAGDILSNLRIPIVFFFFFSGILIHYFHFLFSYDVCVFFNAAFNYYPTFHNVAVVDLKGYKSCSASSTAKIYDSGKDRIKLSKGRNYFICSFPGHCEEGMQIAVYAH